MDDNFTNDLETRLIKYLDNELNDEEKLQVERLLNSDDKAKNIYHNLLIAKDAVRNVGLRAKVKALNDEFFNHTKQATTERNERAKIISGSFRRNLRIALRVAAVFIIVLASFAVYKYMSTTSEKLYANNFIEYKLPVNRGDSEQAGQIDALYNAGDYRGLISAIASKVPKTANDLFLLGIAYLKKDQPVNAIEAFQQLQSLNKRTGQSFFKYETDYYLLLAYIKAKEIDKAKKQLNLIVADRSHPYHEKAKEISQLDLNILNWKR